VINSAVVIGLMCYGGAMAVLGGDVGQPLARLVYLLVSQRAFHVDRSYLLYQLLPQPCFSSSTCPSC